ncbi:permease for cytosine/purines, uracil, thiamine, allantoin-domain-containing protein [Annulohypoxylon truncatum]|uniref:permease for cytosine/purines, uracil, thiamine, allantoin-domain-containing protein n=1 Tax=Annulohypoxylon truncatum TaxID=327061 RepID=UPI002007C8F5|nr:permease for cytosine/purines, uracil, thiamine, allantoin-domain-containing protein [Annulohypoxylon truncatum]KAI1207028.1 permease for cytosine/purines, uracil, thiamine, allantoin-domain-containing protein [Annulohypoxylon truncatum]
MGTKESPSGATSEVGETEDQFQAPRSSFWATFSDHGVELRGAEPVPVEKRTDTRYVNVLTVFATSMTSLLPIGIGSATTLGFGISLRDAALMIVFLQFLFAAPAAYIITIAPLTGMRQMIQSRYCFGKYCNVLTSIIVTLTVGGFAVTGSINGAQCLAAVRPGTLPVEGAIAIIMVLSLAIGFAGYRGLHLFTRWAWIPTLIAIIILVGAAGDQLRHQTPLPRPPSAQEYLGIVAFAAGNMVTWSNVAGDYACYMPPSAPRPRLALYCLFGVALPFSLLMVLGAAIGGAVFATPAWAAAYEGGGIGAVIGTILVARLGDFGRFVLVVLGLSVLGTCGRDVYSVSFNLTAVLPVLRRVPRIVLSVVATAVIVAVAIPASRSFVTSVVAFLSIIGYYAGASVTCFLTEYLWFRKGDPSSLDPKIWNDGRALPTGLSALASVLIAWAFIIPSMQADWYTGPIAEKTGDLGFEFAVVVAFLAYVPVRSLEIKIRGRL